MALAQILTDDFANLVCDNFTERFASNEEVSHALKILLDFGDLRLLAKVFIHNVITQAVYFEIIPEIMKGIPYGSWPLEI